MDTRKRINEAYQLTKSVQLSAKIAGVCVETARKYIEKDVDPIPGGVVLIKATRDIKLFKPKR